MKEYGIYQQCKNGEPYMIHIFDNIDSAKLKLLDMVNTERYRRRPYYVDNDFYKNEFTCNFTGMYYCIKVREVSEYTKYSEENAKEKEKSNIIFFENYKKAK